MSDGMLIEEGCVVTFEYVLRDGEGQVIDESKGRPFAFLCGAGNIVPGLERQLIGKKTGDALKAVVPAAEGYGERQPGEPQALPKAQLGVPDEHLREGGMLMASEPNGQQFPVWIVKVDAENVWLDRQHPLAGVELHFEVTIHDVRKASEEEVAHGHPHGPGGHEH